jgi:hypothetical protein
MGSSPLDLVVAIATRQWGLFTMDQALAGGFSWNQLRWQARPGGPFESLLRSVYR